MFNKWILEAERTRALEAFCARITTDQIHRLQDHGLVCDANMKSAVATVMKPGRVWTRIQIGSSVRYFVHNVSGQIFASASWRKPNTNRFFGMIDTIDQFDWGNYEAVAKPDSIYKMVPTDGHYFTARVKS